ncbi:MAG TPA: DUF4388 domain-containing protein [Candidatus Obscuribacterales bacterium]
MPRQPKCPTEVQIKELMTAGNANAGRTVELPFADGGEQYSLTVFNEGGKAESLWMLYHGEGTASKLEWSIVSDDPGLIHHMIGDQLSGFSRVRGGEFAVDRPPTEDPRASTGQHKAIVEQQTSAVFEPPGQPASTPPAAGGPPKEGVKQKVRPMLEGDLQNMQMPTLLQSIAMGKMTGRLVVESFSDKAVIFFSDGVPLHCELRGSEGETALIELSCWQEGEFRFLPEPPQNRETIRKRLDQLLMEGAALLDQSKFLDEIGVSLESFLVRNHAQMSEQLFEEMVAKGVAADLNLQKMIYQVIDNQTTLEDLLRRHPMPKPRWVPVIFNLITCGLISWKENPEKLGKNAVPREEIDWSAIRAFEKSIVVPETGFLMYPAFFYLLEREYTRFERFQRPFSLLIFELELNVENSETEDLSVLSDRAVLGQVAQRVDRIRRKTDIPGHFEPYGFALLLTETEGAAARNFASRLGEIVASSPLTTSAVKIIRVNVRLGVASVPENCRDLGTLIAAARPS